MKTRTSRVSIEGAIVVLSIVAVVLGTGGFSPSWGKKNLPKTPFKFTPFTVDLPMPAVVQPVAPFQEECSLGVDLPELKPAKYYQVTMKKATVQIIPGVNTEIWGYDGLYPGPSFKVTHNEPAIVRFTNALNEPNVPTIVHNHGDHVAAESDGSASVLPERIIRPGESRDFCYPNIAPVDPGGVQDTNDFSSTQWYHDHTHIPELDLGITGQNVYMGLAGFYLLKDELEQKLINDHVLPAGPDDRFDVPLAIQDRVFNPDGSLLYLPEANNFDGVLGDVYVVNGRAQPKFNVERRKYRFRVLNGSNARWIQLRLSSGKLIQIGADSWLLPKAITPSAPDESGASNLNTIRLSPAERADLIIDFGAYPTSVKEVFLENILVQNDGRRPDGVVIPGARVLKFVLQGAPVANDVTVAVGTDLLPHTPILANEIVKTRTFEFVRKNGRWAVNGEFFDPLVDNAAPQSGTAERWILKNGGGGWAHPIHIHLEAQQLQRLARRAVAPGEAFKKDTIQLLPNEEAEVFIKFRTFTGRYVFHCHNVEHEDMAMMFVFNVH
jgi:FtsP/CotA-like multicopper oxidase with cupredoxin domain